MDFTELKRTLRQRALQSLQPLFQSKPYGPLQLALANEIGDLQAHTRDLLRQALAAEIRRLRLKLTDADQAELIKALEDDLLGFGPMQPLFDDREITEILINGPDQIDAERNGLIETTPYHFDDEAHLRFHIGRFLNGTGKRVDESHPFTGCALSDGTRIHIACPPASPFGPHLSIRKGKRAFQCIEDLLAANALSPQMAEFLKACIKAQVNILFSGATSTGKTTLLEILSQEIDDRERVLVLEDTPEIHLRQRHAVYLLTREANTEGQGLITLRDLFQNALRMRPNRLILGEIRGSEAFDFLQALTSGHRGSLGVIHAQSPEEVLLRFEALAALGEQRFSAQLIRRMIAQGLEIIVQLDRDQEGRRRVTQITEVCTDPQGETRLNDIYRYEARGRNEGQFMAMGYVPRCGIQVF